MAKSSVHQRIDDHEKLCRIMQQETNRKMISLTRAIHRLEKFVVGMIGMVVMMPSQTLMLIATPTSCYLGVPQQLTVILNHICND